MSFVYKPNRQFMTPNETVINPDNNNIFQALFNGETCHYYRFRVFDLQNNLIDNASTNKTETSVYLDVLSVDTKTSTINLGRTSLKDGDVIKFSSTIALPQPLVNNRNYYIKYYEKSGIRLFSSYNDFLNNINYVILISVGSGDIKVIFNTPIYNGEFITHEISKDILTPGDVYKWQLDIYSQDMQVTNVNTTTNTMQIYNHNLSTGDSVYVENMTGITTYKIYYVRKIDNNNIAIFEYIEGARNDAGRVPLSSSSNVIVNNVVLSEQVVFFSYQDPTLRLDSVEIKEQSHTFIPTYYHPQNLLISSFVAYIKTDQEDSEISSGVQENSKLEYYFDGLLNSTIYYVNFVVTLQDNQVFETGWTAFGVNYDVITIGIIPTATNIESNSSVLVEWGEIKQVAGVLDGNAEYVDNFVVNGNKALKMNSNAKLKYENLNMQIGSSPPVFWWKPNSINYIGTIMLCENSTTGDNLEVGYDGVSFYRKINRVRINSVIKELESDAVYLIGSTVERLYVNKIN